MEQDRTPVTETATTAGTAPTTDNLPAADGAGVRSQGHPLDPISLAFGAIFVILGLAFLSGLDVSGLEAPGAWAAVLASVGVLLLAIGARRQKR
jgi:hypothetical protein